MRFIGAPPPPRGVPWTPATGNRARVESVRGRVLAAALAAAAGLAVFAAAPAFAADARIISSPASGTTYGVGETIRVQLYNLPEVWGVAGGSHPGGRMTINVGGTNRQARSSSGYRTRMTSINFDYVVQEGEVDANGISIPANALSGVSYRDGSFGTVNTNHAAVTDQSGHKVDGSTARLTGSTPGWLTWGSLNNARVEVTLNGVTFTSAAVLSHFTVVATPPISGLSVSGVSAASGGTIATVTLSYSGSTSLADRSFNVRVAAAAHSGSLNLTSRNAAPVGATPQATLNLSSASISENGGIATVTATLDKAGLSPTTVTVAAAAVSPAVSGDFTLSTATTLTIDRGETASTGLVTVTGVNNAVDAPDKRVTVSGTVTPAGQATNPAAVTLTIADDEEEVTLALSSARISENAGVTTVTATLSGALGSPTPP